MTESGDSNEAMQRALAAIAPDFHKPSVEAEVLIEIESNPPLKTPWEHVLPKFFGASAIALGFLTIFPVVYFQVGLEGAGDGESIPRWLYLLGFLGSLHVLYGLYVTQWVDFSSLQVLSLFMLTVTCLYGFIAIALLLEESHGVVSGGLQVSSALHQKAIVWCGIMFGITALACYGFGREAMSWQQRHQSGGAERRDLI
ncbi:MAG: hypothetical protein P8J33_08200 [Pirellulaceae bacterium]|nr:hypothetical protein [Pirellulaceae bacterium]